MTHDTLGALRPAKVVDNLRQHLVAGGALPSRGERLAPLESWLPGTITQVHAPNSDKAAGLLALLFAQEPSRVIALTTDHMDISDGTVTLRLGKVPVQMPPPLDGYLLTLHTKQRPGTPPPPTPGGTSADRATPTPPRSLVDTDDTRAGAENAQILSEDLAGTRSSMCK
ncbi:hypothetical protein ACIBRY_05615 [Streptomyces anulatus]